LLGIALYERQSKQSGTTTFYDTMGAVAEKIFDTLPRQLKRLSERHLSRDLLFTHDSVIPAFFEGLVGPDSDISAVRSNNQMFMLRNPHALVDIRNRGRV
jgi:hypothetical protein